MDQTQLLQAVKANQDAVLALAQMQKQGHDPMAYGWAQAQMAQKAAAARHTGTLLHGNGGLFNTPGLSEAIISTHVRARGLGQLLNAFPSNEDRPWFGFLTGFGAESGSEPTNPCDDAPTGFIKSGTLTARFGRVARDTSTIRMPDVIRKINRSDFTDLQLLNGVLNPDSSGVYYPSDVSEQGILDMVVRAEQVIVGINLERKLSKLLWAGLGTGANDTPGGGYKEFPGLDVQIATGQVDAETNAVMAAADSLIQSFGFQDVASTDIVAVLEEMEDHMFNLAADTGVDPVEWVIVMRPQLWRAITSVWPIQYNTQVSMATLAGGEARVILNGAENINQRDQMRAGLYLDINGRRYNVVLDHGITENDSSHASLSINEFSSDLYFIPLTITGNFPITYWQYLDFGLATPQTAMLNGMETWWSDGGRFLWSYDGSFTCFKLKAEVEPRVILRAPHLAFKLQNIKYVRAIAPLRDPDPDSDYWKDGGVSIRNLATPTQYSVWL